MLAPFSISTYLPSYPDIAREFNVSPLYLQQTMSFYLLAFACMTLMYGPLSDAFGRRVVILGAVAVYIGCSLGCALAVNEHWLLAMRVGQMNANVIRVMARVHAVMGDPKTSTQTQKQLWRLAEEAIPSGRAGDFNQALMELGATVCVAGAPMPLVAVRDRL